MNGYTAGWQAGRQADGRAQASCPARTTSMVMRALTSIFCITAPSLPASASTASMPPSCVTSARASAAGSCGCGRSPYAGGYGHGHVHRSNSSMRG